MAIRNSTKFAFANALKSLLNTKELSSIRIQELCRICGTERPTFYYHFRDKYDLIAWIYEQDLQAALSSSDGHYHVDQLENLLLRMQKEHVFYKKAFADSTQNALLPYIRQMNIRLAKAVQLNRQNTDALTPEEEFHINFFTYSWCYCLLDWINGTYDLTAAQYAQLMYRSMSYLDIPGILAGKPPQGRAQRSYSDS